MTTPEITLPPLPTQGWPTRTSARIMPIYTDGDMQTYARLAMAPLQERIRALEYAVQCRDEAVKATEGLLGDALLELAATTVPEIAKEPREVTFKVAGMQERGKLHIEPEIAKEPVAWMYPRRYGSGLSFAKPTNVICNEDGMRVDPTPLYADPPDTRAKALEEAAKECERLAGSFAVYDDRKEAIMLEKKTCRECAAAIRAAITGKDTP